MTKIIIDSNVVFSAILNTDSRIGRVIINGGKYYRFMAPEYIRYEILQHKEKIMSMAGLDDLKFIETFDLVFRNILVVNHSLIPIDDYLKAENLCSTIDLDDTVFVALTEFSKGRLWTGDMKLMKGLMQKGYNKIIMTEELYDDFLLNQKRSKR
jgi:predicted nucleic acid-binding protein